MGVGLCQDCCLSLLFITYEENFIGIVKWRRCSTLVAPGSTLWFLCMMVGSFSPSWHLQRALGRSSSILAVNLIDAGFSSFYLLTTLYNQTSPISKKLAFMYSFVALRQHIFNNKVALSETFYAFLVFSSTFPLHSSPCYPFPSLF